MTISRLDFFAGCLASRTDVQLPDDLAWLKAVAREMDEKLPTADESVICKSCAALVSVRDEMRAAMREIYGAFSLIEIKKIAGRFCE